MKRRHLCLALSTILAACGGGVPSAKDAGSTGSSTSRLQINALDMRLIDKPVTAAIFNPEAPVSGGVYFTSGMNSGATFEVNGARIPRENSAFNLAKATIPDATPGRTLTVVGSRGDGTATIAATCPDEVTLSTVPAASSLVGPGDTVTLSWSGKIDFGNDLFKPVVDLYQYNPTSARHISLLGLNPIQLKPTDTSVTLTLPSNDDPQYDLELRVPGTHARTDSGEALCTLVRRVRLTKR